MIPDYIVKECRHPSISGAKWGVYRSEDHYERVMATLLGHGEVGYSPLGIGRTEEEAIADYLQRKQRFEEAFEKEAQEERRKAEERQKEQSKVKAWDDVLEITGRLDNCTETSLVYHHGCGIWEVRDDSGSYGYAETPDEALVHFWEAYEEKFESEGKLVHPRTGHACGVPADFYGTRYCQDCNGGS